MKKFYITTPIYYVNAEPHIGHAYTTAAADVLARYHRLTGGKVFFLTGTDEHGAKIEAKAGEAGLEPQKFADKIAAQFISVWKEFEISNDGFLRTTGEDHKKAVEKALQFMYDKGDIVKGKYEGLYCRGCEQFKSEKDLINGKCPDHRTIPEKMTEESYVFKMSKYGPEILKRIKSDEFKISPAERKNEIISFYEKEGLADVSFSRKNVRWGVPLPWDKAHTIYVWGDAFLNYLTGLGWTGEAGKAPAMWPADLHLMSKDILRVHATIWPAMLLSLGLPLPRRLFVHGYFLIDSQKMSKSLGNVISPQNLLSRYGADASRYLLLSATAFGHDGDVGWKYFDEKYNADLANGLGNLAARSFALAEKLRKAGIKLQKTDGRVDKKKYDLNYIDFARAAKNWFSYYKESLENIAPDAALKMASGNSEEKKIRGVMGILDEYITKIKPWELVKNKDERAGYILYNILESLRLLTMMLWPYMPATAEKILQGLGFDPAAELKKDFSKAARWGGLPENAEIKKGEPLFPRLEKA